MMPKPEQIRRCLDRYRCLEPTALPKEMPTPGPNGTMTVVEPGEQHYQVMLKMQSIPTIRK